MYSEDFLSAATEFAFTSAAAISAHPLSEALNVPGEPKIILNTLVSCFTIRMEEDTVPELDETCIINIEDSPDSMAVDCDCHIIALRDLSGKWKIKFSFHHVITEDEAQAPVIGIAGFLVEEDSHVGDEEHAIERIKALTRVLDESYSTPNGWPATLSFSIH